MNTYYVYITYNIVNYNAYVGITKKPISSGYLGSGAHFIKALKKYGKDFFKRIDLEKVECSEQQISQIEEEWISFYNAVERKDFYNIKPGGNYSSFAQSTKDKIRQSIIHKWTDEKYRDACISSFANRDKTKLLLALKSRNTSGERNGMFGKTHDFESRQKISIGKKGKKLMLNDNQLAAKAQHARNTIASKAPKSDKHKALVRWGALKKKFAKKPVVSEDMKMMHDFYGVREAMKKNDPEWLRELLKFRLKFLQEELDEGTKALDSKNADEIVDSLIDLVVVAVGTLDMMDVDFDTAWYRVLDANMQKEPGIKASRPNPLGLPDLIKPEGWTAPSHLDNIGLLEKL